MHRTLRSRQSGACLVEQLMTGCIASLVLLWTLPGLEDARQKQRLDSVAAQIETELQYARSLAVARGEMVRVAFESGAGGSCYVMHTGSPRQCTCMPDGAARCEGEAQSLRSAGLPLGGGVQLTSSASEVGIDGNRGTITPTTTLHLENNRGNRVNLVMNIMGRIRSCSPDAGPTGHPRC